ncbi:hypothetical protein CNE_1c15490 [Cupriavidus necator N-1]|jgi:hypothetical protein|uniref:Uncharacterized protein n=1 Tax=Cupriavidus necator (strain ATCC 43291 / DSM 13513 / CCUG 52238 / LMG 8453 / N-1) TaxID=1042878 RepID=G0EU85_CUPNN|nr:hypothetical protein CNE_1c15490 [Cupriavidus necator N-1]KAI3600762.1 hypothetical protein D8I24_4133 [Cupriavidus necator H850]
MGFSQNCGPEFDGNTDGNPDGNTQRQYGSAQRDRPDADLVHGNDRQKIVRLFVFRRITQDIQEAGSWH